MRVLVVGGGGREHALVWEVAQSPLLEKLWCAPGNGGTCELAESVDVGPEDLEGLADFALAARVDLTIVGPEAPLVSGIREVFEAQGLALVGPSAKAAALEGSKIFAKEFMARRGIPTAPFRVFDDPELAKAWVRQHGVALVVKADGLAAGKGVIVCSTREEALAAVDRIMVEEAFGSAGRRVVIEERLEGREASILALVSGETVLVLLPAMDFKRALDGDAGPNTGGMGSIAPSPWVDQSLVDEVLRTVFRPTCLGLLADGHPYQGVLYAGLMLTRDGPRVLEFNCRFGDPETQAILPLLESDLLDLLAAVAFGGLESKAVRWIEGACVCVVLASRGYPGPIERGKAIRGLAELSGDPGVVAFHAGTVRHPDGTIRTDGGRVLGISGVGADFESASRSAYGAVKKITFEGLQYRRDIGPPAEVGTRQGREAR